jgi:hypothetical protein
MCERGVNMIVCEVRIVFECVLFVCKIDVKSSFVKGFIPWLKISTPTKISYFDLQDFHGL